jgi:DNA mismatch repair ATPase MutS
MALQQGNHVMALFDELFNGTNVKEAYEASALIFSGLVQWKGSLFVVSSHLVELENVLRQYSNVTEYCFDVEFQSGEWFFPYRLMPGVSSTRLGLAIIRKEGIMELLSGNG